MKGWRSPYQSTTNAEIPIDCAWRICSRITPGSCDEYPTEMCFGWPNHASYTAITSGVLPAARWTRRVWPLDPEHPWRKNSRQRTAEGGYAAQLRIAQIALPGSRRGGFGIGLNCCQLNRG